ncbi:MAG: hypothetical protein JNM57_09975 [Cyclobacteriaceae bacterium]|nr:hypothetical protein [Cyclobacteriaceae bacterium]
MENNINFLQSSNPYLANFQIAQFNLYQLIREERLRRRLSKRNSAHQSLKPGQK